VTRTERMGMFAVVVLVLVTMLALPIAVSIPPPGRYVVTVGPNSDSYCTDTVVAVSGGIRFVDRGRRGLLSRTADDTVTFIGKEYTVRKRGR